MRPTLLFFRLAFGLVRLKMASGGLLVFGLIHGGLSAGLANAEGPAGDDTPPPPDAISTPGSGGPSQAIDFNRDIRPLIFGKCVTCHGPDENERAAGLRLDTAEGAFEDLGGYAAIVPGDPEASEVMLRITSDDPDMRMPPADKGDPLTDEEVQLLRRWILQEAPYANHWSYEVPMRPELPSVKQSDWPRNSIDFFTLAKMESRGLAPSPQADRNALARRVALDLTGLPPTWEQTQTFVNDPSPDAYERYVDSLLSSPAFGERWARVWLDLARYADSAGYADDPPRTIWAYRDYVIRSLNENKPFDQFTIEQIAGDLLAEPSEEQLVATAFHRNTLTNNEGGTNDEEFRNVAIVDRVNTTMAVWMGTTMACAQCHTHKYDPITQEEYFRFFAFFNSTQDADKRDESPRLDIWSDQQKHRKREITERIAELKAHLQAPSPQVDREMEVWLGELSAEPTWRIASPQSARANRGLDVLEDGSIQASDQVSNDSAGSSAEESSAPSQDTYRISVPLSGDPVTGIRLEVPPEQQRNFVITQIRASWTPSENQVPAGRYLRVELPGKKRILHLAEIQAFSGETNVAANGVASQSSTSYGAVAARVNDGNTDGDFYADSVQHTETEDDPWIEIDLKQSLGIDKVVVWNRTDGDKGIVQRLSGFQVSLLDENRATVWSAKPDGPAKDRHELETSGKRAMAFAAAAADFEQSGFPAAAVISGKPDPKTGWAVAPRVGQRHELLLALREPTPQGAGTLELVIEQQSQFEHHLIDRLRVATSGDSQLTRWTKLPAEVRDIVRTEREQWSDAEATRLRDYFRTIAPALRPAQRELKSLTAELEKMKPSTTVPVMAELPPEKRRVTKIQIRGNYQSTSDVVSEGTPAAFHELAHSDNPTRLDLAHWLVDPDNPLTPRVIVNRHWEQLFGIGIVETSEEFGSQGELPSHPQLLDWLSVEFRDSGWDVKRLIKLIVMSATYRQSSQTTPEAVAADPSNRMLARGPRFRVSAEMIRDQALFVSGLLSKKQFGPPVNPPQPELGLKAAFGSATDWKTSQGEDRYRRGIYTTWRRSSPYPSMAQFDAPNREVCTVRRIRTNTPLQALVTMNDPVYVEAAQAFARRLIEARETTEGRIQEAFHLALIREPTDNEVDRLATLLSETVAMYRENPDAAMTMATDPLGTLPDQADPVEYAAWTVVANVLLNLDEVFMKR